MRTKVCGMTRAGQVQQLDEIGVEFAGFIFYPRSSRYVYNNMSSTEIKKIRGKINKVGVFVNAKPEEVLKTVDECGLYMVQLHGDESPELCGKIANYISVVKAFRLTDDDNILWKVKDYYEVADMFMFDTEGAGYGGTGKKFNWQKLNGLHIHKPFFLSGGIQPEDAENLKAFQQDPVARDLFAIDINSRFEIEPGWKDIEKIKEFSLRLNLQD